MYFASNAYIKVWGGVKMDKFLAQLSSYNILNNLLPGSIFCFVLKFLFNIHLMASDLIEDLFLYYFCGIVISRVGSILVEPILKKIRFIKFIDYKTFLNASKIDPKIEVLSETNNMYRTFIALFVLVAIVGVYNYFSDIYIQLKEYLPVAIIAFLLILFTISYKKQVSYITKRANNTINKN